MIAVIGSPGDYAIIKQVQQLKLAYPEERIVTLDKDTVFSGLAGTETLFMVGHGVSDSGDFRDVTSETMLEWLKDEDRGVPRVFGGIVLLSCYSGLQKIQGEPSLAGLLARELSGHAAQGTAVSGANGYSFGSPEFRRTGRSSVLPEGLAAFYNAVDSQRMATIWLAHKPTHTEGVLQEKLNIAVDTGKTILENLETAEQPEKSPHDTALDYAASFAVDAKEIENQLKQILINIRKNSVAAMTGYLVEPGNSDVLDVINWNDAIDRQYKLFKDLYLWAPDGTAFTTVQVA